MFLWLCGHDNRLVFERNGMLFNSDTGHNGGKNGNDPKEHGLAVRWFRLEIVKGNCEFWSCPLKDSRLLYE